MAFNTSLADFLADLAARLGGPGTLRFVLQPLFALLLGVRDGRRDAQAGRPPYFWGLLVDREHRRAALREGALAIAKPFVISIAVDAVLSYVSLGAVHPGESLVVGCLLVALPYILARALTNRLIQRRTRRHTEPHAPTTSS
jgi:hypothetical protein